MQVPAIGSSIGGAWINSVPIVRNVRKSNSNPVNPFSSNGTAANPLLDIVTLSLEASRFTGEITTPAARYNALYFMYPNTAIRDFALKEVGVQAGDSNDTKMSKIARWVQTHIHYIEDIENYGYDEFWAPPVFTLTKGSGDCEDGAFLIISLALNAGVPSDRLRMYGGEVKVGQGAATGGHGWVGYRRESDNEWIPLDFSYYPDADVAMITPLSEDDRYIDDYFYMDLFNFVETPGTNRVRDPEGYDQMGRIIAQIWIGRVFDGYV